MFTLAESFDVSKKSYESHAGQTCEYPAEVIARASRWITEAKDKLVQFCTLHSKVFAEGYGRLGFEVNLPDGFTSSVLVDSGRPKSGVPSVFQRNFWMRGER